MSEADAPATAAVDPEVAALIGDLRKELVETGTRNRLVHVNRQGRGKFLNIVGERADDVFHILCVNRRKMKFCASATADDEANTETLLEDADLSGFAGVGEVDESRFTDRFLDTNLGTDALQKRLLQMARDARTAEEEQGVNILYLAVGFLAWFEDERSNVRREAPLVLVPVELVRNERSSTYDLRGREEDIVTNLPLQERLRDDFGLTLPEIDVSDDWRPSDYFAAVRVAIANKPRWDIDDDGIQLGFFSFAKQLMLRDLEQAEWRPGELAADPTVRSLLLSGFASDPPLFSERSRLDERLAPADIVQVVEADTAQTKAIEEVRRGRNLVVQGPPGTGKSQTITNIIAAAVHDGKKVLFMAEKMAALDVVHNRMKKCGLGEVCLELHSRHANKREVLEEIGRTLGSRSEQAPAPVATEQLRRTRDELNRIADLLHTNVAGRDFSPFAAMADVVGFIAADRTPPRIAREGLGELTTEQREEKERDIQSLAVLIASAGPRQSHPFSGCRELDLDPVALQRLGGDLASAIAALEAAIAAGVAFARCAAPADPAAASVEERLPRPSSLAALRRSADFLDMFGDKPAEAQSVASATFGQGSASALAESLDAGIAWANAKQEEEATFQEHAWEVSASPLRVSLESGVGSIFSRLRGSYRRASRVLDGLTTGPLPKRPADRAALARRLASVQRLRRALTDHEVFLAENLGSLWRGEQTNFAGFASALRWLAAVEATGIARSPSDLDHVATEITEPAVLAEDIRRRGEDALNAILKVTDTLRFDIAVLSSGKDLAEIPASTLLACFQAMADGLDRYSEWRSIERAVGQLVQTGLADLVTLLDEGKLAPADAVAEFAYACAEARWRLATRSLPALANLAGLNRHEVVETFNNLEGKQVRDTQVQILSRHLSQLPQGAVGEMGIIRGEIGRKRRHKPIRKLIEETGGMIQRIKPVFLMSPISIAQFLPPNTVRFDLLVVDEASQVRPEEALGAIARCRQLVVVGDQKQLPPTSFFDRLAASEPDEEDDDTGVAGATEMESVLTLCEARGMNHRMLEWHYRSRTPSLIRVSNDEFYDGRLILPPSPLALDQSYGLSFKLVPGVYASRSSALGRPGTNEIEARHLVDAVAEHARSTPGLSLGVVAFSKAQADMLTELLEFQRRRDEVLNDFLRENHAEDVFVKNIENVQGDERDVIFISVGYGPAEPGGRLTSMRFGPINLEGGERRLNVLFTRARARCRVFASFDPGDIDLSRTTAQGPRILKRFLDFARTDRAVEHRPTGNGADSAFEEDVANVIRSMDYLADHQVGTAGFRIDVGVRHRDSPGRYILAVECDGAAYHSALSARERDRHRQAVLEGMGWRFHRIWSTDWFHRRRHEEQRLVEALAKARAASNTDVHVPGANDEQLRAAEVERATDTIAVPNSDSTGAAPPEITVPAYRIAQFDMGSTAAPHEVDAHILADLSLKIVEVEGPIHVDLIARRVAEAFGMTRAGGRIAEATRAALRRAQGKSPSGLFTAGEFWLTKEQHEAMPVRDRGGCGAGVAKAAMLPMEIVAAADRIEQESGRVASDELVREVGRLLGFKRVGSELRGVIGGALAER